MKKKERPILSDDLMLDEMPNKYTRNKDAKKIIVILSIGLVLLGLLGLFLWLRPRIVLNGSTKMEVSYQEKYQEQGGYASYFGKQDHDLEISGTVDVNKLGKYTIEYRYQLGWLHLKKERTVYVVDDKAPVITLTGGKEVFVCPNQNYEELGYEVSDNYDKDLYDKVKVTEDKEKQLLRYQVEDSSHNKTIVTRKYYYEDKEAPSITLEGSSEETMYVGQKYVEDGYRAIDKCEGDLTSEVQIEGSVDGTTVGTYTLLYKVRDQAGNEATTKRVIHVVPRPSSSGNGVIYLTFDDGPTATTQKILDILKEEQVKATFFVINHASDYDYLIKRAYDEGHTIGLHSYSHNYAQIYQSADAFFQDLSAIQNKVKSLIGISLSIIRFPGGTSNTISKKYSPGIMTYLASEVENRGYRYYDWNIESGDSGGAKTANDVYRNVINGLRHDRTNIVLLHDFANNSKTVDALRDIIQYGKSNGYQFAAIDESTPLVRHRVNN